jgi:hypothetical protein
MPLRLMTPMLRIFNPRLGVQPCQNIYRLPEGENLKGAF